MIHPIPFYGLSALLIAGALGVILARQPIYAVLSLVVSLFALSAIFIALKAYFVAMIQLLVYAGAILVLFLFVVMLLESEPEKGLAFLPGRKLKLTAVGAGILFICQMAIMIRARPAPPSLAAAGAGTTKAIGELLFTTYALPFELASILLLVGIIGAVVLAKKEL